MALASDFENTVPFLRASITGQSSHRGGFTLLELLVVVVIIVVLAAIASPMTIDAISAARLTTSGGRVMEVFQRAKQQAETSNRICELRIYRFPDALGVQRIAALQVCKRHREPVIDPVSLQAVELVPVGGPVLLSEGIVISADPILSTLADGTLAWESPTVGVDDFFRSGSVNVEFITIRFYPNGSTQLESLGLPSTSWHLTLLRDIQDDLAISSGGTPPANYLTLRIDAFTGRVSSHRPGG